MTADHLAKLQAGRAAAKAAKVNLSDNEETAWQALHAQAYIDLLRCRAQNDAIRSEQSEPSFLNID